MKKLVLLGFAVVAMAATTKFVVTRKAALPENISVGSGFTPVCPPICCPPLCPKSKP